MLNFFRFKNLTGIFPLNRSDFAGTPLCPRGRHKFFPGCPQKKLPGRTSHHRKTEKPGCPRVRPEAENQAGRTAPRNPPCPQLLPAQAPGKRQTAAGREPVSPGDSGTGKKKKRPRSKRGSRPLRCAYERDVLTAEEVEHDGSQNKPVHGERHQGHPADHGHKGLHGEQGRDERAYEADAKDKQIVRAEELQLLRRSKPVAATMIGTAAIKE